MKTYGIFTAYSPDTRFEHEGLGRYLATFLKASEGRENVRFAVACPSWSRKALTELFDSFDVDANSYSFVGPAKLPLALQIRTAFKSKKKRRSGINRREKVANFGRRVFDHLRSIVGEILASRNPLQMLGLMLYLLPYLIIFLPLGLAALVVLACAMTVKLSLQAFRRRPARYFMKIGRGIKRVLGKFDRRYLMAGVYRAMLRRELQAIVSHAAQRSDVAAWYCPTALWPAVHSLAAPKLICIPDMVLSEFPVPFAGDGEGLRLTYQDVVQTVSQPAHFVTYSERTKWSIAVDRFGIDPAHVSVIAHGANDLSAHTTITGFPDLVQTGRNYREQLLARALHQRGQYFRPATYQVDFPYIFYASQFRPSKNLNVLLRAYEELQRNRHFGRKLILTGNVAMSPDAQRFVQRSNLHNDVVFLPGLSTAQLAAAYSLADLAVNPSLSEGGMPFTFTEALSVGTPVVMGDIEVTREVLVDNDVLDATLFDPYDWRALADKIEWALANREHLYSLQRQFYDAHLATRTWSDVVDDHIQILDRLTAERVVA